MQCFIPNLDGNLFFYGFLTGLESPFFGLGQTAACHGAAACLPCVILLQGVQVRNEFGSKVQHLPVVLGGYSLAGLFALWAASETDGMDGVAAASPSVWIRDWLPYAESHPVKAKRVYLSLGDREEKTRNPVLSRVGDCVRGEYDLLKRQLGETNCALEWNIGGHFADADKRLAKGFVWNLRRWR